MKTENRGLSVLLGAGAFVICIAGIQAAQSIVIPFVFSILLAVLGTVPLRWLQRIGVPGRVASTLVALCLFVLFTAMAFALSTSIQEFLRALPQFQGPLHEFDGKIRSYVSDLGINLNGGVAVEIFQPERAMRLLASGVSQVVSVLSNGFLIMIFTVLLIFEAAALKSKLKVAFGETLNERDVARISLDIQRYVAIKTMTSALTGLLVGALLWSLNVSFFVLWGGIAFLFNFVPFIGSIIAAIPAALWAYLEFGAGVSGAVALGYLVVNLTIGNIIEPVFMGRSLGLSAFVVLASVTFWGWVWGPTGMLLAVPIAMIFKILCQHSPSMRWVSVLLSDRIHSEHPRH